MQIFFLLLQLIEHLYLVDKALGKSQRELVLRRSQILVFVIHHLYFVGETAIYVDPLNVLFEIFELLVDVHLYVLGSLSYVHVFYLFKYTSINRFRDYL